MLEGAGGRPASCWLCGRARFCFTVLIVSLFNCKASTSCMKKPSQQFIRDMNDDAVTKRETE
jgi:hypothetical protein